MNRFWIKALNALCMILQNNLQKFWLYRFFSFNMIHLILHLSLIMQDPKRHLEEHVDVMMTKNIVQCLGAMLHTVVFK